MFSRRSFIRNSSKTLLASALGASGAAGFSFEMPAKIPKNMEQNAKKLGVALVGLGKYSSGQLAPALQETQNAWLAGVVSGSPGKAHRWQQQYGFPEKNIYSYDNFDALAENSDIDIVYIVLPNAMHAEFTIRALEAGKHVICEKPMATSVEDCDRMLAAAEKAGKMLSIGYRLHFEPYNGEMMRLGQNKVFGPIQHLRAENGMNGTEGWRLDRELAGGGPLMDLGIYCVQGVRYTTGMEPIAVTAIELPRGNPLLFKEVEAGLKWQLEFPGGLIAECATSYEQEMNLLRAEASKGSFELAPAYPYSGQKGHAPDGDMNFPHVNQQALQIDDFAAAVRDGRPTPVPGEMGRQDVKILMAIYEAMRTGSKVSIE